MEVKWGKLKGVKMEVKNGVKMDNSNCGANIAANHSSLSLPI